LSFINNGNSAAAAIPGSATTIPLANNNFNNSPSVNESGSLNGYTVGKFDSPRGNHNKGKNKIAFFSFNSSHQAKAIFR
jgi:hypothetical protein